MSIVWIALWVLISGFIIGIFVWTTRALQDQKKVWKAFAAKRNLVFRANGFFQSAVVGGTIEGYGFYLSSEERPTPDIRGRKFVSVVQFTLPVKMSVAGVVGSGDYLDFVRGMNAEELVLTYEGWAPDKVLARAEGAAVLAPYFTTERLKVLDTLMKQKGVSILFLFDPTATYLRLETGDPLLKTEQLDKLISGILPMLKVFNI